MRTVIGVGVASVVLLISSQALAFDIPLMELRVGVRGGPNINIISDVAEEDPVPVYPGFVGVGWFVGGTLSFDWMKIVGLQIEFLYSSESASGTVEFDRDVRGDRDQSDQTKEESDFTLSASGLHIPLFIRGSIPTGVARPFLHLGVDFAVNRKNHEMEVTQGGDAPPFTEGCVPGVDCDPFPAGDFDVAGVNKSTFLLIGLGIDIDVGPVTVPIEFRGLFNPGFENSIVERTEFNPNGNPSFLYQNEMHYQVFIMFGVNYVIF